MSSVTALLMKIHKNSLMDHGIIKTLFSVQQKLVRQLLYEGLSERRKATVSEHEQKVIKCEERKRKKGLKD